MVYERLLKQGEGVDRESYAKALCKYVKLLNIYTYRIQPDTESTFLLYCNFPNVIMT